MAADLHTHSEASADATVTIEERARLAGAAGLDTVAVTDHRAVHPWFDGREGTCRGIGMIAGVEINPCTGAYGDIHVLGLLVDPGPTREAFEGRDGGWEYEGAIDAIHAAGGAAIMAHPGRYDVDLGAAAAHLADLGIDGIETDYPYGDYDALSPAVPYTPPGEVERIATEHDLVRAGGSDCHGGDHEHMGAVSIPRERVEAVRRAARRHR